jgi:hypothetical protein
VTSIASGLRGWRRAKARSCAVNAAAHSAPFNRIVQSLREAFAVRRHPLGEVQIGEDHGEVIVEVVRHAARELTDRFHLLRVAKALLKFPAMRDVPDDFGKTDKQPAPVVDRLDDNVGQEQGAVLALRRPSAS